MADGFEKMVDAAQPFFRTLKDNNEKAWFEPRKAQYQEDIRKPAELFADLFAEDLSRLTGIPQTPKVFRIYRDVRFSKDKSPYNPYLHILWASDEPTAPGWFFAVEAQSVWFGMGLLGLSGDMLTRYRDFIDKEGDAVTECLGVLSERHGTKISDFGPPPLKRIPKPFAPDHQHGALLKRKGFALGAELPSDWRDHGLVKTTKRVADAYLPLWSLIREKI